MDWTFALVFDDDDDDDNNNNNNNNGDDSICPNRTTAICILSNVLCGFLQSLQAITETVLHNTLQ